MVPERVVRQWRRAHGVDQAQKIDPLAARGLDHGLSVCQESDIVLRRDVLGEAVRHVDVFVAVKVEIRDERAPAPVRPSHARHLADVRERAVAVVELQHVPHQLVVIPLPQLGLVDVPALEGRHRLEPVLVLRQHVGGVDVGPAVVVHVRDVEPHREVADGRHRALDRLGEGAISVVEVQVVVLEEVIRDVDVGPAVPIHVAHDDAQPEADLAPEDPGLLAHVDEVPAVVAIQPGAAERVAHVPGIAEAEARDGPRRVTNQEQVQVSVAVVVEEHRLGRVARVGDAVGGRLLDEGGNAVRVQSLVDVQLVGPKLPLHVPGVADVDVEQPVAVHVGEGDARGPPLAVQARLLGHVAEAELPFVQVEARAAQVRREHDLRQAVAGEIPQRDAAAVVVVAIGEDVQIAGFGQAVLEADAGIARGEQREEVVVGRRCVGALRTGAAGDETRAGYEKT